MSKESRFVRIHSEGSQLGRGTSEIWVDRVTGVNYLYHVSGYSGGLTPLLDSSGKPVVSPLYNDEP